MQKQRFCNRVQIRRKNGDESLNATVNVGHG
ncbi:Uncharacterised protein [Serratia marcescens]|nr:Uncharacterised protein [Serratia marcescens]